MSRLIVKGLPKNITEAKLRSLFESKGTITDIQLKYTKEGVFRQFAFVGYQSDEQAEAALKHFNNAYIQTSRVKVEICAPLGSQEKPKAWSKYSKESTAYKKEHGIEEEQIEEYKKEPDTKNKKKEHLAKILEIHKDDPKFKEFLEVHSKNRNLWENDAALLINDSAEDNDESKEEKTITKDSNKKVKNKKSKRKQSSDDELEAETEETADNENNEDDEKLAEKKISDIDYMKSLMKKSFENDTGGTKKSKKDLELFTIKLHNIPYKVKRQDILKFFKPFKAYSVRLPTRVHGFCYVGFKTEKEFEKAQIRNKSFIKGKQIFFSDFTEKNKITKHKLTPKAESQINDGKKLKWQQQEEELRNEESIAESGRIFFRNLSYTVNEDDIQQVFEKYGPVADVSLPIDSTTRKIKGFGTVTFVMPEHAVTAFSELDGTLFHGRLFHLMPGKSKELSEGKESEGKLNFRQKKELDLKKTAGLSHNWNTLFLGANAVADLLAKRFDASKETVLDSKAGGSSAAVRLALGETQIVMEMKKFLEDNDVRLRAFDEVEGKRSKTVILAKNLPGETTVSELRPVFSKFGLIGRIVLPPSGVTALIEFLDPSEAKKAFKNLAYSTFKSLPLYLEWAPENTFKSKLTDVAIEQEEMDNKDKKKKREKKNKLETTAEEIVEEKIKEEPEPEDDEYDDDPEPETTLFLRNLNFKTREDVIRAHFKHLGAIHMVQVAMRKDPDDPKTKVSLGYGFIQFKRKITTEKALKTMQFTQIEGNQVELKRSDRVLKPDIKKDSKKSMKSSKQTGSKILVRNIPFQAKVNEVREIFKAFGELKFVRLPKKMTPGEESHRGFGFVDFISKSDAKKAFDTLSQSTHLYGRRLALEWAATDDTSVDELRKRTADNFGYEKSNKFSRKSVFDANVVNSAETNGDYA